MSILAPGTYVTESQLPAFTDSGTTGFTGVFVGAHQQGPTIPTLIQSWPQFQRLYGGFGQGAPSNLALAVYAHLNGGGGQCWVVRVTHGDAATATSSILEPSTATIAAPTTAPTLTVVGATGTGSYSYVYTITDAEGETTASPAANITTGPTALSANDYVAVNPGTPAAGTAFNVYRTAVPAGSTLGTGLIATGVIGAFDDTGVPTIGGAAPTVNTTSGGRATLGIAAANPGAWANQLYYSISTNYDGSFNLFVYLGGTGPANLVERWTELTMGQSDPRYCVALVNNAYNGSTFVRLTDLLGTQAEPGPYPAATNNPVSVGGNGSNGSPVTDSDLAGSTSQLDTISGEITINFPAIGNGAGDVSGVLNPIITYCNSGRTNRNAFLIIDPPQGETAGGLQNWASGLTPSSYAAVYGPWAVISDPVSPVQGAQRTIPPGALVMAAYAVNDATRGLQKAPAGLGATIPALDLEVHYSPSDQGLLVGSNINPLIPVQNHGIVIWGARTLSPLVIVRPINIRRQLIDIEQNCQNLTRFAAFEDNNVSTWTAIYQALDQYLRGLWSGGAFAGDTAQDSYFIVCDSSINNSSSDTINAQVGVALSSPAEYILLNVSQWAASSSGTVTATTAAGTVIS